MAHIERDGGDHSLGYTRKFCFSFRAGKDADVIATLDAAPNMVDFVRQAIREKVVKDSGCDTSLLPANAVITKAEIVPGRPLVDPDLDEITDPAALREAASRVRRDPRRG